MKEIRLDLKFRNNIVLSRMEELGIPNVAELCRRMNCPKMQSHVGELINLKRSPLKKKPRNEADKWSVLVLKMAEVLYLDPEAMFPESVQAIRVPPGVKIFAEVTPRDLGQLVGHIPSTGLLAGKMDTPEMVLMAQEFEDALATSLKTLRPIEEQVIKLRFGLEDGQEHKAEEVGRLIGRTAYQVKMIEAKALRKLRHPSRSRRLKPAIDTIARVK